MASFYYPQVTSGNSYILNTPAGGVVVPIYSATAQVFGLWNPSGTGKNLIIQGLDVGIQTLGTPVVGSFALCYQANVGNTVAASNPITANTKLTPLPALIGGGSNSVAIGVSVATFATGPSLLMTLGMSNMTTSASNGLVSLRYLFDDAIAIAPGGYIGVGGIVAPGETCNLTLRWYEQ